MPNNFDSTMPPQLSNKAIRAFKDQYLLDFVNTEDTDEEIDERVLEQEIVLQKALPDAKTLKKLMNKGTPFNVETKGMESNFGDLVFK